MKIYLVRHGIAVDRIGGQIRCDAERPLTDEGREETERVALGLRKMGVRPEHLVSSPLVRARQTAEIFASVFDLKQHLSICEALSPSGKASQIFNFLADLKKVDEVALFGHQPDMTGLAQALLWAPELDIPFKKAGCCRIDVYDMPPRTPGTLKWHLSPRIAVTMAQTGR